MLKHEVSKHVEYVIDKVSSLSQAMDRHGKAASEPRILGSWERCLTRYNLDPSTLNKPRILPERALKEHRESLEEFLLIAKPCMTILYNQVAAAGYVILLGDANGVTLDHLGNPDDERAYREAGLYRGALWAESVEGTCGVGTCIEERRTVTIHRDEHFRARHIGLSCTCTPLFFTDGTLLGTLDISLLSPPTEKESQLLATQIMNYYARMIENAYFLRCQKDCWIVMFNRSPAFVEVAAENILAVNQDGIIVAANNSAIEECGRLVNRHINELFDIGFDGLVNHALHKTATILPVRSVQNGKEYFTTIRAPESRVAHPTGNGATTVSHHKGNWSVVMTLEYLAGTDTRMIRNVNCAKRVMNKDISILLTGETGTGKEVFARAVHNESDRSDKPFVALNCASIPESLIESELFGYRQGAFTGASNKGMRGKILQADGGTLFLDEIGDMPLNLQTRLLRVLAEKEVIPLGSEIPIRVNLNVICATLRNLEELVRQGQFREDLYYRLNGVTISLPSVRDREDKGLLIRKIVDLESGDGTYTIDHEVFRALLNYDWPGNVRQLRNVLRYAMAMNENGVIGITDLPLEICACLTSQQEFPKIRDETIGEVHPDSIKFAERSAILNCLAKQKWNITSSSKDLCISRATLYRKMKHYSIISPNELNSD
jgi:transcriptional regulator of acetoin/glycerol metabolism